MNNVKKSWAYDMAKSAFGPNVAERKMGLGWAAEVVGAFLPTRKIKGAVRMADEAFDWATRKYARKTGKVVEGVPVTEYKPNLSGKDVPGGFPNPSVQSQAKRTLKQATRKRAQALKKQFPDQAEDIQTLLDMDLL